MDLETPELGVCAAFSHLLIGDHNLRQTSMFPCRSCANNMPSDVEHTLREPVIGVICAAYVGSDRFVQIRLSLALH